MGIILARLVVTGHCLAQTRRAGEFEARLGQPFPLTGELDLKREQLAAIEADVAATTAIAEAA